MESVFSFTGKTVIVTGGGRGIGRAIALGFAQAGANVVVCSRTNAEIDAVAEEIRNKGGKALAVATDLTVHEQLGNLVDTTVKEFGRIDILVNAAGITRRTMAIDFTRKDWDDVLDVNLTSLFFLCQKVAQQFIKQGTRGKIINIASLLSFIGGVKVIAYTASKSAVKGITMHMANEWAKYNINVNAIAPGYVVTDLTKPMRNESERVEETLVRIPAGRWAQPEDMAGAAVFLASEASEYINGFTIAVDGGCLGR